MSPELRAVLQATVVDGMTAHDAALVLGIPEGSQTKATSMRIVNLYGRSRGWLPVVISLALVAVAGWWAAGWLGYRNGFWDPHSRIPVVAACPLIAAALVGSALGSRDLDLDTAAPVRWVVLRASQVLMWTWLAAAPLGLVLTTDPLVFGSSAIIRNVMGYIGLACAATVLIGARLAWAPGLVIAFALYFSAPDVPTRFDRWWAWSMQDGRFDGSWGVAIAFFVTGLALYSVHGPKRENFR